jgi:ribonuclease HIII
MAVSMPKVYQLNTVQQRELVQLLQEVGIEIEDAPYMVARAKTAEGNISLYTSGKLVLQGKGAESLEKLLAPVLENSRQIEKKQKSEGIVGSGPRIGTDESGKGDYFGPLVIAGVYVDEKTESKLVELGVKDSKKISDPVILKLEEQIKALCPYSVVFIGPERYNTLYQKIKNLNRLLAWGHARVIENLLQKVDCHKAITDQFGDESLVKNSLMDLGKAIELEQRPRAEADPAVAAASIIARAEFVRRLEMLSEEAGEKLPKGAGSVVDQVARRIYQQKGIDGLTKIAKTHFATTAKIMK